MSQISSLFLANQRVDASVALTPRDAGDIRGGGASGVLAMLARQARVATSVNAAAGAEVSQSLPPRSGRDGLISRLAGIDPKLARGIEALLAYLAQTQPEVAEELERSIAQSLGIVDSVQQGGSTGPATPQRVQQVTLAIEATIAEVRAETDQGGVVTAQSVRVAFRFQLQRQTQGQSDPLVLDLDGAGFQTSTAADGAWFDLLGTDEPVKAATITGNTAFLVLDRNGNGAIDSGKELFGDQNGAATGFGELAKFDDNRDGWINDQDPIYGSLKVWREITRNGRTDDGELQSLSDVGIAAINLAHEESNLTSSGNKVARVGEFVRADGSKGRVGDLLLNYMT